MLPIYGTLTIFCSTRARSHSQRVGRASGKSLGAAFLLPADYAREDKDGGVPPAASAGALPRGGRSLTGLQGPCHPRLLGCGGLPGTEGTRHQCARLALGPALHSAAGGRSLLPVQPSSLQATLGQSPHIHVFREKLGFGKGKGSEHPLHLHPAARRHGDGAGTGCGSWGQSSPRTAPGLLLLLLPRQRQYDLLKLFFISQ